MLVQEEPNTAAEEADADPDYTPSDEESNSTSDNDSVIGILFEDDVQDALKEEPKYIVFWSALKQLLALCVCSRCGEQRLTSSRREIGTALRISFECRDCHHRTSWASQPNVGKIPAGNMLLSAAILCSGALVTKTLTVFQHMGVACISARTYFRHQKDILFQAVQRVWQENQLWLFASLQADQRSLVVGGDGRADSPGHSAKYGTYTLMEMEALAVIDVQLVQVPDFSCQQIKYVSKLGKINNTREIIIHISIIL